MKVNGFINLGTAEIRLHNKNFTQDNQLLYTAIHEYAHHLRVESGALFLVHTYYILALFNTLLMMQKQKEYTNAYDLHPYRKKIDEAKALQHEILLPKSDWGYCFRNSRTSEAEAIRYEESYSMIATSLVTVRKCAL
jgi:hypothetical protein